jgi:hypothetical protein
MAVEKDQTEVQFLTTEHFTLQAARSGVISESNGRFTGLLTTTSASVVAMALVAQVTESDKAVLWFALAVFPALLYLGVTTFVRIVQLAKTDGLYIQGMNRIRNYFIQAALDLQPYVTLPIHDDLTGIYRATAIFETRWQMVISMAGQIAVLNSLMASIFAGILSNYFISSSLFGMIGAGLVIGLPVLVIHYLYNRRNWNLDREEMVPRFPSDDAEK